MLVFEQRKQSWAGRQDCFLCSNTISVSMWYLLWAFQSKYHSFLNFDWNAGVWIEETNIPGTLPRIVSYVQTPVFQCGTYSEHFRAGTTLHKFFIQLIELPNHHHHRRRHHFPTPSSSTSHSHASHPSIQQAFLSSSSSSKQEDPFHSFLYDWLIILTRPIPPSAELSCHHHHLSLLKCPCILPPMLISPIPPCLTWLQYK